MYLPGTYYSRVVKLSAYFKLRPGGKRTEYALCKKGVAYIFKRLGKRINRGMAKHPNLTTVAYLVFSMVTTTVDLLICMLTSILQLLLC